MQDWLTQSFHRYIFAWIVVILITVGATAEGFPYQQGSLYWHPFAAVSPPRRFGLLGAYRSIRFYVGQPWEGAAGKGDPHPLGQGRGYPHGKRLCHRSLDVFNFVSGMYTFPQHFRTIACSIHVYSRMSVGFYCTSGQSHALYMYTVECL